MKRIIKIGMNVHTTNYTLCVFEPSLEGNSIIHQISDVKPDVKFIVDVIDKFKEKNPNDVLDITCGYETGCLGYSLYHELEDKGINCVILAPITMKVEKGGKKIKNDSRDSRQIAECLAYGGYSAVHIPTSLDNSVKEFIRMRDDIKFNEPILQETLVEYMVEYFRYVDRVSKLDERIEEISTKEIYVEKSK